MKSTHATHSAQETEGIGEALGKQLRGGEVIELSSDLGGGKTTFVRGLARGAGSQDRVASPTFTISKIYDAPHFSIHHFDFYRLQEPGLIRHELEDVLGDPGIVTIIEWSAIIADVLPPGVIKVAITSHGENDRTILIDKPGSDN